jgi:hypothetical protein
MRFFHEHKINGSLVFSCPPVTALWSPTFRSIRNAKRFGDAHAREQAYTAKSKVVARARSRVVLRIRDTRLLIFCGDRWGFPLLGFPQTGRRSS